MTEPEEIALVEVLSRKGEPLPGASFEREQFIPPGKTSDPWVPFLILIPLGLKDAFRRLFPEEAKNLDCETRVLEGIGSRHALALYGPAPQVRDVPKEAPVPAVPVTTSEPSGDAPEA